jgi:hypothetical protein
LDELFDAHFIVGAKKFTYRLDHFQSAEIYRKIGLFISTGEGSEGLDLKFGDNSIVKTFCLDTADAFTLYRRLGTYLQKRCPGNELPLRLHEATS